MAFAFVLPASRPLLDTAGSQGARPVDADRAASALRADYERWSRWGLGLLAFVLAALGLLVAVGMVGTIAMLGGVPAVFDVVVIVVAAGVAATGVSVLVALWRSGRRMLHAASWWMRLPYTHGGRQRRAAGWLQARTVNFEPRVFARITTATLALLLGLAGVSLLIRDLVTAWTSVTAAFGAIGMLALVSGCAQFGGVLRLVSALSEADPLWVRIRSTFRG
ncbi:MULTISPECIES: hypothetical protein [unclassified Microbacterium]|uniref:hypothetical protein n=1 Tax=unclassified Microbacterium TaxID=2609290 RepID=UPI00344AD8F0